MRIQRGSRRLTLFHFSIVPSSTPSILPGFRMRQSCEFRHVQVIRGARKGGRPVNGMVRRRTLEVVECGARRPLMKIHVLGIDLGKTVFSSRGIGCEWAGGGTEAVFSHPVAGLRLTLARKIAAIPLLVWKKGFCFDAQHLKPHVRVERPSLHVLRKVPLTARLFGASTSVWLLASCWPGIRGQGSTSLIRLTSFIGVLWPTGKGFYCAGQFL